MIVEPKEEEGIEELWQAESKAFDENDWETSIYGDSLGFLKVLNNYQKSILDKKLVK